VDAAWFRRDDAAGRGLAHGGEVEIVRDRLFDLSEANRAAIYRFLGSL